MFQSASWGVHFLSPRPNGVVGPEAFLVFHNRTAVRPTGFRTPAWRVCDERLSFGAEESIPSNSKTQRTLAALSAATGLVAWAAVSKADTYDNDYANDGDQINLNSSTAWVDETSPTTDSPPPGVNDVAQFDSNTGLILHDNFHTWRSHKLGWHLHHHARRRRRHRKLQR